MRFWTTPHTKARIAPAPRRTSAVCVTACPIEPAASVKTQQGS
jgi:hypothetical protein